MLSLYLLAGAVATVTNADIVKRWTQSNANCQGFYADVHAEWYNFNFTSVVGDSLYNETYWIQYRWGQLEIGSTTAKRLQSCPKNIYVNESFPLWFEYCTPKTGTPKGVFQAVHGSVGSGAYWNVLLDGHVDNSFAEAAAADGWATLYYDRFGVGKSATPNDGVNLVQSPYEVPQAINIAGMLRTGAFENIPAFNTVVAISHSAGARIVTAAARHAPETWDANILTGYTNNITNNGLGTAGFANSLANYIYPDRFGNLSNSYLITPSMDTDHQEWFHWPNFTISALELFSNEQKGTVTFGQSSATFALPLVEVNGVYDKPTLVITGDKDSLFCGGDCSISSLGANYTQLDTARDLYPNVSASHWETYLIPDTGHGISYHTTAYNAYQEVLRFVADHL